MISSQETPINPVSQTFAFNMNFNTKEKSKEELFTFPITLQRTCWNEKWGLSFNTAKSHRNHKTSCVPASIQKCKIKIRGQSALQYKLFHNLSKEVGSYFYRI